MDPLIYIALIHYPVLNRKGEEITSAVTNLDIHDISRLAVAYGVKAYYIVTPIAEQQALARQLIAHWTEGVGGELNPHRRQAMEAVRIVEDIKEVKKEIMHEAGAMPISFCTSAKKREKAIGWPEMKRMFNSEPSRPFLLLFGTASGLSEKIITQTDGVLAPIEGIHGYNHISVRSAVSITLDRLLSRTG